MTFCANFKIEAMQCNAIITFHYIETNNIDIEHEALSYLIKADVSGKTSDKSKERKDGDEQKLESVGVESERIFLFLDIDTDGFGSNPGSCGSGQKSGDGSLLLAFEDGKTIVEDVVGSGLGGGAGLSGFLVVKVGDGFHVEGRVDKDGFDGSSGGSSGDLSSSELEVLGLFGEGRVSLAGGWGGVSRLAL